MPDVLGWDIGGVNIKVAAVRDGRVVSVRSQPFEIQRAPGQLAALLQELAQDTERARPLAHAVTMTAELSQVFRTKRDGVAFVLDAVAAAFPDDPIHVYTTDAAFIAPAAARAWPLRAAAANWMATASLVSQHHHQALLVDVGTTTTDLIPVGDGAVTVTGRTDPDRLASGELVYTGAVRTPVEAIIRGVSVNGTPTRVSAEGFALTGDVHVWLGELDPNDYEAATPDSRPTTREFARERLARVICADRDMLDDAAIDQLARSIAEEQVAQIATAIAQICRRQPSLTAAVVTGLGWFIGTRAARAAGLPVESLSSHLGDAGARCAPATAVALLLEQQLAHRGGCASGTDSPPPGVGRPIASAGQAIVSGDAPVASDGESIVSDNCPITFGDRPIVSECRPLAASDSPIVSVARPIASSDTPIVSADKPIASSDSPIVFADRPIGSSDSPIVAVGRPIAFSGSPIVSGVRSIASSDSLIVSAGGPIASESKTIGLTDAETGRNAALQGGGWTQRITVVKLGGALLRHPDQWHTALNAIAAGAGKRLVVVPGGGPFADTVREVDAHVGLTDTAAHWMAIAGMDQHTRMIVSTRPEFTQVSDLPGIVAAHANGQIPVLAPLHWLSGADPLPHSWDVTSDSIAAWVAGQLGAAQIVLVKAAGAGAADLIDPYFARTLLSGVQWTTCDASGLEAHLRASEPSRR